MSAEVLNGPRLGFLGCQRRRPKAAAPRRSALPAAEQEFDYVIVGGGTAGCLLANRLSGAGKQVLVLEAGRPDYEDPAIRVPAGVLRLFQSKFDWHYETEQEKHAKNRRIYLCRGAVLGGSSCTNVCLYTRGSPADYDVWKQEHGIEGWSAEELLPYFKRTEASQRGTNKYHNDGGEWGTGTVPYQNPLSRMFLDACKEIGSPANDDFNDWDRPQLGHGRFDVSQRGGKRVDAASALLEPCVERDNLSVYTGVHVRKVIFEGKTAVGIEYSVGGSAAEKPRTVKVRKGGEVILTAGAIATPHLLMLSGIGPAEELQKHGVDVKADLPGVGQNLQDHPAVLVSYNCAPEAAGVAVTSKIRLFGRIPHPLPMIQWLVSKTGPLTSVGCDHGGFFRCSNEVGKDRDGQPLPDVQLRFLAARAISADGMSTMSKFRETTDLPDGFSFQVIAARPFSRGQIKLQSADPSQRPLIDMQYCADPRDKKALREGLRLGRKIASTSTFSSVLGEEVFPGAKVKSDAELDDFIASTLHSANAIVGTCRMGRSNDPQAVVETDLRLKGFSGLRICDASVIPSLPGGQSGSLVVAIAERAADLLLGKGKVVCAQDFSVPRCLPEVLDGPRLQSILKGLQPGKHELPLETKEYDYLIVGGGTAGCLLANRLSAEGNQVLVLEAGRPNYENPAIRVPAGVLRLFQSKFDWHYETEQEKHAKNRRIYLCRGAVLGGSSCTNVCLYTRGSPADYDVWKQEHGIEGWSAEELLPYFKRTEASQRGTNKYHGDGGEWGTGTVPYQNPLSRMFLDACQEIGSPANDDFNNWDRPQLGHGRFDVSQRDGKRVDAASALLEPCLDRENLSVYTGVHVRKVIFEGKAAVGIEYCAGGSGDDKPRTIKVRKGGEVILTAGAIATPHLLMLSGVGPAEELKKHGVDVKADLPGVGQNLQDHPAVLVSYNCGPAAAGVAVTSQIRLFGRIPHPLPMIQWLVSRTGPLTSVGCDHGGFFRCSNEAGKDRDGQPLPDVQLRFLAARAISADGMSTMSKFRETTDLPDGISFQVIAARPFSRGQIKLQSADPSQRPLIDMQYCADPRDKKALREGLRLGRKIASTSTFSSVLGEEVFPGAEVKSDAELDDFVASTLHSANAIVGTCRMGRSNDPQAVVETDLRLKGFSGLRICDASVIPSLPGGQSGSLVVAIAERAADLLLAKGKMASKVKLR